jgi:hypothetical protein
MDGWMDGWTDLCVGAPVGGEHVEPEERVPDEGERGGVVARATCCARGGIRLG